MKYKLGDRVQTIYHHAGVLVRYPGNGHELFMSVDGSYRVNSKGYCGCGCGHLIVTRKISALEAVLLG